METNVFTSQFDNNFLLANMQAAFLQKNNDLREFALHFAKSFLISQQIDKSSIYSLSDIEPLSISSKEDALLSSSNENSPAFDLYKRFKPQWQWRKEVECPFCRTNGEPTVEINHPFKDCNGYVLCPKLFKLKCKICGATGREAHTEKYCSFNPITHGDPQAAGLPPGLPPQARWRRFREVYIKAYIETYNSEYNRLIQSTES